MVPKDQTDFSVNICNSTYKLNDVNNGFRYSLTPSNGHDKNN